MVRRARARVRARVRVRYIDEVAVSARSKLRSGAG